MADYQLNRLGTREFEHVTQALAKRFISQGVTPFGDGPDGGREATYDGPTSYPDLNAPWNGYLVIQCKFRARPGTSPRLDAEWARSELHSEVKAFQRPDSKRRRPDYFLFVTNVVLTAVDKSGGKDMFRRELESAAKAIGAKGWDVWSYDELCRFLDESAEVRAAYAGLITPGDVLLAAIQSMSNRAPSFEKTLLKFLQKELVYDKAAKLESAARSPDGPPISLASVFVDLPYSEKSEEAQRTNERARDEVEIGTIEALLLVGAGSLRKVLIESDEREGEDSEGSPVASRIVLVGGPGQGKSTLAQYLCQLHRVALLRTFPMTHLDDEVQSVIGTVENTELGQSKYLRIGARFPFRIVLNQYATDLTADPSLTVLEYIRRIVSRLGQVTCALADITNWLEAYPWLVVLDGLDEVPASSNRIQLLREIETFRIDLASLNADVQIVCTTRPQSYTNEFQRKLYKHWYLRPLSRTQALRYATRLVEVRSGSNEPLRDNILRRLELACNADATARLMQSPLQVTIMALLVERIGEPPRQRYRLFEQYYRTIYEREIGREGPLSALLSERKTDIDTIHYRAGLVLQTASETAGRTEARLPEDQFRALVKARFQEVGVPDEDTGLLLTRIGGEAVDRLVFLVRPVLGQVAFEIRSLQEFMAAEALLKGDEESVVARMHEIASISHWRNVFLFAVGKCFADLEHLLPRIYVICQSLNDCMTCVDGDRTLWGSRLALDILQEGVAAQNPKYERLLAELALKVVVSCDQEYATRFAEVYRDNMRDVYMRVIADRLGQSRSMQRIGAWRIVSALADKSVPWALQVVARDWPTSINEQESILGDMWENKIHPWAARKIESMIPHLPTMHMLGPHSIEELLSALRPECAEWLPAVTQVLSDLFESGDVETSCQFFLKVGPSVTGSKSVRRRKSSSTYASFVPIARFRKYEALTTMPEGHLSWCLFQSGVRFSVSPSRASLSSELRWLSKFGTAVTIEHQNRLLPWPLAACIRAAKDERQFIAIADLIDAGDLGDESDWSKAEARWEKDGITLADFQFKSKKNLPFDRSVATIGFPFSISSFSAEFVSALFSAEVLSLCSQDNPGANWLASELLLYLNRHPANGKLAQGVLKRPETLVALLDASSDRQYFSRILWIADCDIPEPITAPWVALLRKLAQTLLVRPGVVWFDHRRPEKWSGLDQICGLYASDPVRYMGLLKICQASAVRGQHINLNKDLLFGAHCNDEIRNAAYVILLLVHDLNQLEMEQIIDWYLDAHGKRCYYFLGALHALERHAGKAISMERFTSMLNNKLMMSSGPFMPIFDWCQGAKIRAMNSRKSPLGIPSVWSSLKLPVVS